MSPSMLDDERVKRWFGGVKPAWTLLDLTSFVALTRSLESALAQYLLSEDLLL